MELENAVPREIDYVDKDGIVRYKEKKDNRGSFVKTIYPYTSYNCSKIGVEYFFENVPPKEREDEPDLPFGNRDESVWNMRGWLRDKDFLYNNE
jgi:hypothetical protein